MLPAVKQHQPDAVIFLGDLQAQRPLHVELAEVMQMTEIHWVLGNHDTDSEADFDHLFEGNSIVALIGIVASFCAIFILLIFRMSKLIEEKTKNQ